MEEKIEKILLTLDTLVEMYRKFDSKFEIIDKRFDEIDNKFEIIDKRFDEIDNKFEAIDNKFGEDDSKFASIDDKFDVVNQKIEDVKEELRIEMKQEMNNMEKRILDQLFLFEQEYGTKIDAIFDAVTLELDKNLEKSVKIRKLDGRMDRCEATLFNHEKRISNFELNSWFLF